MDTEHREINQMTRPRELMKITLPVTALAAMQPEHRSALLMLGVFLNEANWLCKLLVGATLGISDSPDGQASFSLTTLLATTLAGKIHEGWDRIEKGWLHDALADVDIPDELKPLRAELTAALSAKTLVRIRNNVAFHYPEKPLSFWKLEQHIEDSDATVFVAPEGYGGDVLSHLSTLAGIEPLLAIHKASDYRTALEVVWNEVTNATGLYCRFVSELMAFLIMKFVPSVSSESVIIPDAPEADATTIRFFVHPPSDLEEMHSLE